MDFSPLQQPSDRRWIALGDFRVLPDEILSSILELLTPRDVARLSCVSSVLYILCNEEPLWMNLCLNNAVGLLEYKGSWKDTALWQKVSDHCTSEQCRKPLRFDGFSSLFLYRRWYRRYTTLDSFSLDEGQLDRKNDLLMEEFLSQYDGQKPVLITNLAENWPAKSKWTIDQLVDNYGETAFRISQRSPKKVKMRLKDYVSYMKIQHDEDPLYIFDDKFGEVAPTLLSDYTVPYLFQEDFFDVLDEEERAPFRWLIIGPERSGASWHVDPCLTSAWNTLLLGRKRWAFYPPGRVPLGVTVHVNEEDGDVNIETPSSLQWWLDIYPLLSDEDKPLECTQRPGETIFVPSGWWHCVLNLETTIAVTQNFVNTSNFEFVCLDLTPGYQHKGVCRAGLLALHEDVFPNINEFSNIKDPQHLAEKPGKNKKPRIADIQENHTDKILTVSENDKKQCNQTFAYDIDFLTTFIDEEKDHFGSVWNTSNCIGQRELRGWLRKLWATKPAMRSLIWKGACIALNAEMWLACVREICDFHSLPSPSEDERLPTSTGSNPVFFVGDHVIKIYVEGGLGSAIHSLGSELEFYSVLSENNSLLSEHIPLVFASGILFNEYGSYRAVPWDGKGVPHSMAKCNFSCENVEPNNFCFGIWNKKQFEFKQIGRKSDVHYNTRIWPYIITKRCQGEIFANLRNTLPRDDVLNLASFLGEQMRNLHLLPVPPVPSKTRFERSWSLELSREFSGDMGVNPNIKVINNGIIPMEWELFIEPMKRRKKDILNHLIKWGDPIPSILIEKVQEYMPHDLTMLLDVFKGKDGEYAVNKSLTWIHSDVMDDNVLMEPLSGSFDESIPESLDQYINDRKQNKWCPRYILDFSDLSIGDPIYDLIPIYLDIFRGDSILLKRFLESYGLPFSRTPWKDVMPLVTKGGEKHQRLSYHAMCYCILHPENVLGPIFTIWKELRAANFWEEVEEVVWGVLNDY